MAQYGVVSQLLALVQWRARAHACVTGNCHDNAETAARRPVTEWLQVSGPDSWLPWPGPGLLTDWLWLKLAIIRWPTWAVLVRLCLQAHCQCGASTWTWLCEVSSCRGNLSSSCQLTHHSLSRNKSMRGIKSVAVQLDTRPQFVGGGEAGGGGAPGPWRPQPAPARRAGDVISEKQVIS
jgi:hypothetical protein